MFYAYLHRRVDTNEVFYIGKGFGKRAESPDRGKWWKAVVAKAGGRTVQILAHWPTEAEAFEHERFLIACFRDLGAPLCNMTGGGDGASGAVRSAETRAKMAAAKRSRTVSAETCAKISLAKRNPGAETRAKISAAGLGRVVSAETRAKIGAFWAGRKRGPPTVEHRAKISAGQRARHAAAANTTNEGI